MTPARPGAREALPIEPHLPEISSRLAESGALVLSAEPGAGKTSMVPLYLAAEGRVEGKILLLEPRRIAAVAAASRIASLLGEDVGGTSGYRVRLDSRVGPATRILAMTEGVLVRMLQEDPSLAGAGLVVFDEFHERSSQADLALALCMEVRSLRPSLRILVMSATLDVERVAAHLGAPSLRVPGRSHPVETRHAPLPQGRGFEEALAALAPGLARESGGDVLAFLPGRAEIGRAARALASSGLEVLALHGSLPLEEQRRVLAPRAPGAQPRIVLATSVAETSLTVPGVRAVLDSGLARLQRFHVRTGLNRLVTEREATDRAEQRRGRAGRLGPGLCLRAWPASDVLGTRTEPELLRAELSSLVLEAAAWGARNRGDLPWLDLPPEGAWEAARELLGGLGALDASGAATERGRRMASLGTEPRLAALVLRGEEEEAEGETGAAWTACRAAALLSEGETSGDLEAALDELDRGGPEAGRVLAEARRLARGGPGGGPGDGRPRAGSPRGPGGRLGARPALGPLLAAAYPDRVARRAEAAPAAAGGSPAGRGGPGPARPGPSALFRLPSGRVLRAGPPLSSSAWIVAAEADAGEAEGKVFSGAALDETEALRALAPLVREAIEIEWRGLGYRARRLRSAGAIVLSSTALGALGRAEVAAALAARLAGEGLGCLPWGEGPGSPAAWLARARRWTAWAAAAGASATGPAGAGPRAGSLAPPALDDAALLAGAGDWLAPFVQVGPAAVLDAAALRRALEGLLGPRFRAAMDRDAPERLSLPSGSSRPVDYGAAGAPALEGRVQEFYGLSEQPRVLGAPLVLRLLDPGGKPLQVTSDLPGFWKGAWAEARKDLRGAYPRHDWPEDPFRAAPSRSGLKRRRT